MASLSTTLILLSVLFSGSLYTNGRAVDLVSTLTEESQFDFFELALQWQATLCPHENKCCPQNGCCQGANSKPPTGFTIYGLWPDYNNGSWPSGCEGPAFDESKITPLLHALHTYWPSCNDISSCNNKMNSFWADHWEQHGICSTSVTGDQYGYFLTGLELYLKYNVTDVLSKAGYVPTNSKNYPLAGLISAIENAFHAKPQFLCAKYIIFAVRLCFTKDLQPRECARPSSCPDYVNLLPKYAFVDGTTKTEDWLISTIKISRLMNAFQNLTFE